MKESDSDSESSSSDLELEIHTGAWTKHMTPNEEEHEELCDGKKIG